MRTPLAAWRAGIRAPLALIGVLVVLVAAIAVCEATGWRFLVGPVQRQLAATLDRRVVFGGASEVATGARIGLIGSIRVTAESIEIGSPDWSATPHMLLAHDARLELGYFDLWRAWRGGPLRVRTLEARELDANLERLPDGRASWQFGANKGRDPGEHAATIPTFGRLRVGEGHLLYVDGVLPAGIDARFALSDGTARTAAASESSAAPAPPGLAAPASGAASSGIFIRAGRAAAGAPVVAADVRLAPGESGLHLEATGQYRKLPVRVGLRTSGVLGLLEEGTDAHAQPLSLRAAVGRARLSFDGSTTDPLHFAALKGRFALSGASLAAIGDALHITLPTTPAFDARGTLVEDEGLWKVVFDAATIGSSRLNGAFTYDTRRKVPLLSGRLGGSRLVLLDLGPAVGAPAAGGSSPAKVAAPGRVIPDRKFDLPSLRAMDANVLIEIGVFDPGTDVIEPLRPARAHLLLADGVLTIADFEGITAQGKLVGYLQLDGRGERALWTADLRMLGLNLGQWLHLRRSGNAPPYISGRLDALVKVKGSGRSTAEILASLEGDVRTHIRDGEVSHFAIEVGGLDVAQALGVMVKGDDALPIQCNVGDLDIVKGVARPKVMVVNTRDSTIWVDGTASLRDEGLDLRVVVAPKDFSPLTLRTPVHVKGTLGKPLVSLEAGKLVGKAVAAGLLALLNPLAAIIPFIDPGAKKDAAANDANCASLVTTSGAIPGAVRNPKSTPVPPLAPYPSSAAR
jgi:AsmA family protein